MSKLIVANWKLNPQTYREAENLVKAFSGSQRKVKVVICPPFVWLTDLSHKKHPGLEFGAQDVFWENKGAYTGEISPAMLKSSGVKYVIVGHSERRRFLGETDDMVNRKVKAALKSGLKVVLCVGEGKEVRRRGKAAARRFVKDQLRKDLNGISGKSGNLLIAYEPVWAISTTRGGWVDTPEDAAEMIQFIKDFLKAKSYKLKPNVLYGGSVTSVNAARFLKKPEIDGALVGGASIKQSDFKKIIKNA